MSKNSRPLIIVLSPHFDDGVLSLGGLMAKREYEILVATFFTHRPTEIAHTEWNRISGFSDSNVAFFTRTKENEEALIPFNASIKNYDHLEFQYRKENQDEEIRIGIAANIKSIIATYKDRELFLYGPSSFGEKITHPDHQIVHDSFMDVYKMNDNQNIHFLIYEDFPYIRQFMFMNSGSFNDFLNKKENITSEEKSIELSKSNLEEKISSIYTYKSQIKAFCSLGGDLGIIADKFFQSRCRNTNPDFYACEVVHILPNK